MTDDSTQTTSEVPKSVSPWRITGWICLVVVLTSTLSCITIAAVRSAGLVAVVVVALDQDAEPRDHAIPFIKRQEALPDYQVMVILHDGHSINLGTKPDTSAANGLKWSLNDPVSTTDVASVRLQDQDKLVSDVIAEVQINDGRVISGNYEFQFRTERLMSVGVQSFFKTPIGKAIAGAFCIAILLLLASVFCA